jgi:hypothetical protein
LISTFDFRSVNTSVGGVTSGVIDRGTDDEVTPAFEVEKTVIPEVPALVDQP